LVFFPETNEIVNGTVIGLFSSIREIAGRQLAHPPVIMQAVAAYCMLAAGVGTITILAVSVFVTFHGIRFKYIFILKKSA